MTNMLAILAGSIQQLCLAENAWEAGPRVNGILRVATRCAFVLCPLDQEFTSGSGLPTHPMVPTRTKI